MTPDALVREAARAGFSSVGLRLHLAMAGGIAYPLAPGSQALRQLKTTLDSEGVVVNEIEFVELKPQVDVAGFASLLDSGAQLDRRYIHGVQWCDALAPTGGGESSAKPARVACRPVRGSCPWPGWPVLAPKYVVDGCGGYTAKRMSRYRPMGSVAGRRALQGGR